MEVDQPGTSGSRKRTVDADNNDAEISDPKRPRIHLDSATKEKVLKYIVNSAMKLNI